MGKPTVGIAVDGSSIGNPGIGEYRGIDLATGQILFQSRKYSDCSNNQAEFLAVVHAIGYCKQNNLSLPIWSDSQTARAWVRDRRCGSSHATSDRDLQDAISRADAFLARNGSVKIETWKTREFGEIAADYGRKGAWR